jgi:hypothetical protein
MNIMSWDPWTEVVYFIEYGIGELHPTSQEYPRRSDVVRDRLLQAPSSADTH